MFSGFLPAPLAPRFKNSKTECYFERYKLILCILQDNKNPHWSTKGDLLLRMEDRIEPAGKELEFLV
jgi:hypothetical protein